jgi:hypothetical protein
MTAKTKRPSKVTECDFNPDADVPADPITGLQVCRTCHRLGAAGDARHQPPPPAPPLPPHLAAAARARDAAILGERLADE